MKMRALCGLAAPRLFCARLRILYEKGDQDHVYLHRAHAARKILFRKKSRPRIRLRGKGGVRAALFPFPLCLCARTGAALRLDGHGEPRGRRTALCRCVQRKGRVHGGAVFSGQRALFPRTRSGRAQPRALRTHPVDTRGVLFRGGGGGTSARRAPRGEAVQRTAPSRAAALDGGGRGGLLCRRADGGRDARVRKRRARPHQQSAFSLSYDPPERFYGALSRAAAK